MHTHSQLQGHFSKRPKLVVQCRNVSLNEMMMMTMIIKFFSRSSIYENNKNVKIHNEAKRERQKIFSVIIVAVVDDKAQRVIKLIFHKQKLSKFMSLKKLHLITIFFLPQHQHAHSHETN